MISLQKPTYDRLKDYLWRHQNVPFTYDQVEGTRGEIPAGFTCGRQRVKLGTGRACYLRSKKALQQWKMFPSEFVELIWPCPIEKGQVVATLFRAPGCWTLNPCRIVYTIDDLEPDNQGQDIERFGFAYGTVGRHLASGEERFSIEYHHADESVWYEIYCFSKAKHWLAICAYPYLRLQQHRFRGLSAQAMKRTVAEPTHEPSVV